MRGGACGFGLEEKRTFFCFYWHVEIRMTQQPGTLDQTGIDCLGLINIGCIVWRGYEGNLRWHAVMTLPVAVGNVVYKAGA